MSVRFASPGEYPVPETEQGRALGSRLRGHGLDFDRSIWNVEQEARSALDVERLATALGKVLVTYPPAYTTREQLRDHRDHVITAQAIAAEYAAAEPQP